MRKSMFLVCAIFLVFMVESTGQDILSRDVPSVVINKFEMEYPKATDVDWEKEKAYYKVDFELRRGVDFEVWYTADGNVFRKEEEIKKSKLPEAVRNSLSTEYSNYRIDDVKRITENGKVQYEVDLDSRQEDLTVWIDEGGQVLGKGR